MRLDDPASYEVALRRLIELRFKAEKSGQPSEELARLEAEIYGMVRDRPNPLPDDC
jgi:hypothetical protein